MKTKEELNALKEELKSLNEKLSSLTEEELAQVCGGVDPFEKLGQIYRPEQTNPGDCPPDSQKAQIGYMTDS